MSYIIRLIGDKEYSIARYAAEFFRNLSRLLQNEDSLDLGLVYKSLLSLEQSDDIFLLNINSLANLFSQKHNGTS